MDCVSCQGNERVDELPLRERIGVPLDVMDSLAVALSGHLPQTGRIALP